MSDDISPLVIVKPYMDRIFVGLKMLWPEETANQFFKLVLFLVPWLLII
jgi:hypothetical protein